MSQLHDLLGALRRLPALPEANCLGRWELFDMTASDSPGPANDETVQARRIALGHCAECPELATCRRWVTSLPVHLRPAGVVGGRIIPSRRAKKEIA